VRGSEPGAEVGDAIQVMRLAEAARVYARQAELGTEAENAATSIRLKAEIKLAEVVTEGQRQGEIEKRGQPNNARETGVSPPATLAEIGVTSQRLSEARDIDRTMGPGQIDALVAESNDRGRTLSGSAVLKEVRKAKDKRTNEFYRPPDARCAVHRAKGAERPVRSRGRGGSGTRPPHSGAI